MFKIKSDIRLSDQEVILNKIAQMPGVANAARLVPDLLDGNLARICYVQLEKSGTSKAIQKTLNSIEELEDISVPTDRKLTNS